MVRSPESPQEHSTKEGHSCFLSRSSGKVLDLARRLQSGSGAGRILYPPEMSDKASSLSDELSPHMAQVQGSAAPLKPSSDFSTRS